jgi:hypothetical protein
LIILIILGEEYKSRAPHYAVSSILPSPHPSSVQISSSAPLFSNTLSLCSSLNVRDQVSHPYRTTGETNLPMAYYLEIEIVQNLSLMSPQIEDEKVSL